MKYLTRDTRGRHLSTLVIEDIQLEDSGEYTCQPAAGAPARVLVHVLQRETEVQAVLGEGERTRRKMETKTDFQDSSFILKLPRAFDQSSFINILTLIVIFDRETFCYLLCLIVKIYLHQLLHFKSQKCQTFKYTKLKINII